MNITTIGSMNTWAFFESLRLIKAEEDCHHRKLKTLKPRASSFEPQAFFCFKKISNSISVLRLSTCSILFSPANCDCD